MWSNSKCKCHSIFRGGRKDEERGEFYWPSTSLPLIIIISIFFFIVREIQRGLCKRRGRKRRRRREKWRIKWSDSRDEDVKRMRWQKWEDKNEDSKYLSIKFPNWKGDGVDPIFILIIIPPRLFSFSFPSPSLPIIVKCGGWKYCEMRSLLVLFLIPVDLSTTPPDLGSFTMTTSLLFLLLFSFSFSFWIWWWGWWGLGGVFWLNPPLLSSLHLSNSARS